MLVYICVCVLTSIILANIRVLGKVLPLGGPDKMSQREVAKIFEEYAGYLLLLLSLLLMLLILLMLLMLLISLMMMLLLLFLGV